MIRDSRPTLKRSTVDGLKVLLDVDLHPPAYDALRNMDRVEAQTIEPNIAAREIPSDVARDTQFLVCTRAPTNLDEMEHLEVIQLISSGYAQLFGLPLSERGIRACNARGVFDVAIAEWSIAMIINLARNARELFRNLEHHVWDPNVRFHREVRGSRVGIWGYGGIGRETARLAKAMGMEVSVLTRNGVSPRHQSYCVPGTGDPDGVLPDRMFTQDQSEVFLKNLDFLVIAAPLTNKTEGMIGERELSALPQHAYLLNPARGAIVKEAALIEALKGKRIAGCALDAHYHYPMPPDHPLWSLPNVIMTPHISGSTQAAYYLPKLWDIIHENVRRTLAGEPLLNELTAEQLAGA